MPKKRLDQLLVDQGLAPTREKAQALVLSGSVLVNDQPASKAGVKIDEAAAVRLRGEPARFVSRGGEKIEPVLLQFQVPVQSCIAVDIGASTGGFTDCLLQLGASRVYAVDVGSNQLDFRLRTDPRVIVMEKTHVLHLSPDRLDPRPDVAVVDVSFIGLRRILQSVYALLNRPGHIVALVKPQFELGPEFVSKGGVVKDEKLRLDAVELVKEHGIALGLNWMGFEPSPIKGSKKGNQEYFVYFKTP